MPEYHGKTATASYGGTTFLEMLGWTCDLTAATADSTAVHASNTGRTRNAGFNAGTATVQCYQGDTQTAQIGQSATLVLKRNASTIAYTGTAICTNIENGADKAGNVTVNYSFKWTGTVANS
jgi:hypothetical protein